MLMNPRVSTEWRDRKGVTWNAHDCMCYQANSIGTHFTRAVTSFQPNGDHLCAPRLEIQSPIVRGRKDLLLRPTNCARRERVSIANRIYSCGAFSTQIHPIISKKDIVGPNYIPISCVKVSHPKKHGPPRSLETFSWHPWHHHAARRCICASWGWVVRCTSMWCWRVPGIFWWPGGWCKQNLCEFIAKLYIRICLYTYIRY